MSLKTRRLLVSLSVALAVALGASAVAGAATGGGSAPTEVLTAVLRGSNEVPPADPDGVGGARITIDTVNDTVCFVIGVRRVTVPAINGHIHEGDAGVNGPVVVQLAGPDGSGMSRGCLQADSDLLDEILADPAHYYVNIHTTDFPAGSVRGQLRD